MISSKSYEILEKSGDRGCGGDGDNSPDGSNIGEFMYDRQGLNSPSPREKIHGNGHLGYKNGGTDKNNKYSHSYLNGATDRTGNKKSHRENHRHGFYNQADFENILENRKNQNGIANGQGNVSPNRDGGNNGHSSKSQYKFLSPREI
jgi:hypothetical protein